MAFSEVNQFIMQKQPQPISITDVLISEKTKHEKEAKEERTILSSDNQSSGHISEPTRQRIYPKPQSTQNPDHVNPCDPTSPKTTPTTKASPIQHESSSLNAQLSGATSRDKLNEPQKKPSRKVWALVRQAMMNQLRSLRDSWIQLAGHKGCFMKGSTPDTILKRLSGQEENCFNKLKFDELAGFVPKVKRKVFQDGEAFLEMQDLLACFKDASVMDVKMGCRTYREDELENAFKDNKLRSDMYEKMIEIDQNEPTQEEKQQKAVTKPRYMIWRETISSSASLGFRIEGMRLGDGTVDKEFKTIRTEEQVAVALARFTQSNIQVRSLYLNRLKDLKNALEKSQFFTTHELIGSSLLFVHDQIDANIWLIDFAKTHTLPNDIKITHSTKWEIGNHEDGYLIGIDNLIKIFEQICEIPLTSKKSDSIVQSSGVSITEHIDAHKLNNINKDNNNVTQTNNHQPLFSSQNSSNGQTVCE